MEEDKDKSKWIIRLVMNAEEMFDKNISMDDIHFAITNMLIKMTVTCIIFRL